MVSNHLTRFEYNNTVMSVDEVVKQLLSCWIYMYGQQHLTDFEYMVNNHLIPQVEPKDKSWLLQTIKSRLACIIFIFFLLLVYRRGGLQNILLQLCYGV